MLVSNNQRSWATRSACHHIWKKNYPNRPRHRKWCSARGRQLWPQMLHKQPSTKEAQTSAWTGIPTNIRGVMKAAYRDPIIEFFRGNFVLRRYQRTFLGQTISSAYSLTPVTTAQRRLASYYSWINIEHISFLPPLESVSDPSATPANDTGWVSVWDETCWSGILGMISNTSEWNMTTLNILQL